MKKWLKQRLGTLFHFGQRFGVDILPRHFYSEIPDFRRLRSTTAWQAPYSMQFVLGSDIERQSATIREWLREIEPRQLASLHDEACRENGAVGYGKIEAQILYAFVRRNRPARIFQVGAGVATAICLRAARECGYRPEVTCVDPYPSEYLKRADVRLIAEPVENLGSYWIDELQSGDLFFVDSTHTLGPAGECTRIICDLLPRLKAGVYVHFHDIFLPFDFSPRLMTQLFFWHETALLLAFLTLNPNFEICASLSMLHHANANELSKMLSNYEPEPMKNGLSAGQGDFPSSIYLRRREFDPK
jgi:hypothetical protein